MPDIIKVEILEDGVLSIETEALSEKNHISADDLLQELEQAVGSRTTKKKTHPFWEKRTVKRGGKIVRTA